MVIPLTVLVIRELEQVFKGKKKILLQYQTHKIWGLVRHPNKDGSVGIQKYRTGNVRKRNTELEIIKTQTVEEANGLSDQGVIQMRSCRTETQGKCNLIDRQEEQEAKKAEKELPDKNIGLVNCVSVSGHLI